MADVAAGGAGRLCPRHRTHALRQGVRRRRLQIHREGDRVGGSRRHGGRQGEGIRSCQVRIVQVRYGPMSVRFRCLSTYFFLLLSLCKCCWPPLVRNFGSSSQMSDESESNI